MHVVATRIDGTEDTFSDVHLVAFTGHDDWYDHAAPELEGVRRVLILNVNVYASYLSTRSY